MNARSKLESRRSIPLSLACLAVASCFMHTAEALPVPTSRVLPHEKALAPAVAEVQVQLPEKTQAPTVAEVQVQIPVRAAPAGGEINIYRMLVRRSGAANAETAVRGEDGKIYLVTRNNAGQVLARSIRPAVPNHARNSVSSGGLVLMR